MSSEADSIDDASPVELSVEPDGATAPPTSTRLLLLRETTGLSSSSVEPVEHDNEATAHATRTRRLPLPERTERSSDRSSDRASPDAGHPGADRIDTSSVEPVVHDEAEAPPSSAMHLLHREFTDRSLDRSADTGAPTSTTWRSLRETTDGSISHRSLERSSADTDAAGHPGALCAEAAAMPFSSSSSGKIVSEAVEYFSETVKEVSETAKYISSKPVKTYVSAELEDHASSSPHQYFSGPAKYDSSPMKDVSSPMKDVSSPMKDVSSPMKDVSSPMKYVSSPMKDIFSEVKHASSEPENYSSSSSPEKYISSSSRRARNLEATPTRQQQQQQQRQRRRLATEVEEGIRAAHQEDPDLRAKDADLKLLNVRLGRVMGGGGGGYRHAGQQR